MYILGIVVLILATAIGGLYLYINYKSKHIKDNKNLEIAIDKQANKFVSDGNAIGLVIGVIKNGTSVIKGYGTVEKGKQILPDSASVYELASTSKLYTTST
jgi:CubicO group peptidase (beta-lactamase class C family)